MFSAELQLILLMYIRTSLCFRLQAKSLERVLNATATNLTEHILKSLFSLHEYGLGRNRCRLEHSRALDDLSWPISRRA